VATAVFRFHGGLRAFLPKSRRDAPFAYACARAATLKNAIEALGVPHTEAGVVTVNGEPATLQRIVREGDRVEVFPPEGPAAAAEPAFLADSHLGGLARFLRMLGFDTLYENGLGDAEIRRLAREERRIVLTRDRELLKCADIAAGAFVRELKAEAQLREVAARYDLAPKARPFTRCLSCNLPLEPVDKRAVLERLPESVSRLHESFLRCAGCDRVYWRGSHYERMNAVLRDALERDFRVSGAPPSRGAGR
jgi:hypothetical protein